MWTDPHARAADELQVFYVEPVGGHRGMHYYDFELCQALQSAFVHVTLLTCGETLSAKVPPSLRVEFPFRGIYGTSPKAIRGIRYLRGLVTVGMAMLRHAVPLAHFHYFHYLPVDYLYLRWLQLAGRRVVVTVHDVVPFDTRPSDLAWLRRLYHTADRLIVHANSNRDAIIRSFGVGGEKISVIPMGPYLSFAKAHTLPASMAKQRLALDPQAAVVLFFGQIKKVKGLQYLIQAFGEVAEHCPHARLVIAGPEWKESFAGYDALIQDMDLRDKVLTRIEYVPDDELGTYFSAADVVALPYTECYQSAVLYMAYSFGKPVVASTVGGLTEVVEDGVNGALVPPADVAQLAAALRRLLEDSALAGRMGNQGRALVEEKFRWPEIARQVAAVYAQVLHASRPEA